MLPLTKQAISNIEQYKDLASETQFSQMLHSINMFNTDLKGSGFNAIQAKQKLTTISQMSKESFVAVCKMFK